MEMILDILGYNICNYWIIISKGFWFQTYVHSFVVFVPMKGVLLWALYSILKRWLYLHIDHTGCTGNNHCSTILITETIALLEHSADLHINVCIIWRVSFPVFSTAAVMEASMLSPEIKGVICIMESAKKNSWTFKQTGSNLSWFCSVLWEL